MKVIMRKIVFKKYPSSLPLVGIFWCVKTPEEYLEESQKCPFVAVADFSTLEEAADRGDCLVNREEPEVFWKNNLSALYGGALAADGHEDWPRGRVCHHKETGVWRLSVGGILSAPFFVKEILRFFHLGSKEVIVLEDPELDKTKHGHRFSDFSGFGESVRGGCRRGKRRAAG
jgi:hypothetical protein